MPRPVKGRTVGADARLARSIREVREARGWSPAGLAERMQEHGCPTPVSAIYKVEADQRTVKPDELVTLARIFGVSADFLLGSSDDGPLPHRLMKVVRDCRDAAIALWAAQDECDQAQDAVASEELRMIRLRAQLKGLPADDQVRLLQSGEMPAGFLDVIDVPEPTE